MNITIITATIRLEGLKKTIESIDNQTYKKWQHVIVNDNNNNTRKQLNNLCKDDRRRWIDLGVRTHWYGGIARNIGAMVAFSYIRQRDRSDDEWITFHDDDNLWYPNHLETLVQGHREKPEATLIGVDMEIRGCKNLNYKKIKKCQMVAEHCDLGSFIYHKGLFDKYGYFRPRKSKKIRFDWELINNIVKGEGTNKVHIIHKPTFIFYHKER